MTEHLDAGLKRQEQGAMTTGRILAHLTHRRESDNFTETPTIVGAREEEQCYEIARLGKANADESGI